MNEAIVNARMEALCEERNRLHSEMRRIGRLVEENEEQIGAARYGAQHPIGSTFTGRDGRTGVVYKYHVTGLYILPVRKDGSPSNLPPRKVSL